MLALSRFLLIIAGLLLVFDGILILADIPNPLAGLPLPCPLTIIILGAGIVLFAFSSKAFKK
jgi:hypothetical protein